MARRIISMSIIIIIIIILIIISSIIQPLRAFRRADLSEGIWRLLGGTLGSLGD